MLVHDFEQGSPEWFQARCGIATASEFSKIITTTGKPSTQREAYLNTKVAELLAGGEVEKWEGNQWTERGNELEANAVAYYEFINDAECKPVGFVTDDERTYGASPDRLIGDDGLLEVKCPAPHTHVSYLREGKLPTNYFIQVQGQLLVTERKWCDFISYHPKIKSFIVRVDRDEPFIDRLRQSLIDFNLDVLQAYADLTND